MTTTERASLGSVSPLFIVADVVKAANFYQHSLGFELRHLSPDNDPFFAIVGRDAAQLMLKAVDDSVSAQPNVSRHAWVPWDAFVYVEDVPSLRDELLARNVTLQQDMHTRQDGLTGIEVVDVDGYVLFFGKP